MTRFIHLDKPLSYPFFDIVLRDSNPGGCFDLSVLLEDYTGSLYVRDEHIIEMARQLGMATVSEVAVLKAHIESLEAQIGRLPSAQEELRNGLANLVSKFHRNLIDGDVEPSVGDTEPEQSDPEPEPAIGEAERSVSL